MIPSVLPPAVFFVFDVESIGLHGEGFAVGVCVVNRGGGIHAEHLFACSPEAASGDDIDRKWIAENIPALEVNHATPAEVRRAFWSVWAYWKSHEPSAVMVADCGWPVEARFLAACMDDAPRLRKWEGPYPLHDLASVMLALGHDPLVPQNRLPEELPAHNPMADARQSARILTALLQPAV